MIPEDTPILKFRGHLKFRCGMIGDSLPLGINRSVVICEGREIYGRLGERKKERKFFGGGNDKKCLAFVRCCYCVPSSLVGHSHQLRKQISVWPVF
ncbi:hypothetical protein CDAR_386931 [Caerostris darwini]|uniref:Uncharacterized protein n=1 Tax=Caerostris darwini TaxID=1538125 RepID=A0AAV4QHL9_9ARAC|nr:hypothetical protein CDAR_386931 [Caerostris darwini]